MATKQRKTSSSRFSATLFTLLFGLILGLAIAAAVAYFITQVPMPFSDKASRSAPNVLLPNVRDAPDPNQALMGEGGAGSIAEPDAITPPKALPGSKADPSLTDDIGALLATLGAPTQSGNSNETAAPRAQTTPSRPSPTDNAPAPGTQTTYYLQAGAFRSEADAETMRARIILMGLPTQVQSAQVNGGTLYRVRLGPFKGIDEMNQARAELSNAKIESSVVRP